MLVVDVELLHHGFSYGKILSGQPEAWIVIFLYIQSQECGK